MFFVGVLLVCINIIYCNAKVSLNYPGWIFEDKDLPGIPSKNLDQYKSELKSWSRNFQTKLDANLVDNYVALSENAINNYISRALDIGFENEVYIDVDGVNESINIKNYQVKD